MGNPCARFMARVGLALLPLAALTGCPSTLDELLDKSRIFNASASPQPVPAPQGDNAALFTLRVEADSNDGDDRLWLWVRNPARNNEWHQLAIHDACASGGGCGNTTKVIDCASNPISAPDGNRLLVCGDGPGGLHLRPGTHRWRVDISRCHRFSVSCSGPDDSIEFDVSLR